MASSTTRHRLTTQIHLGGIKFSPVKKNDNGHVTLDWTAAGEDIAIVLTSLVPLQGGTAAMKLTAGRAGEWKGNAHVATVSLKPPKKAGEQPAVTGRLVIYGPEKLLQDLLGLRLEAAQMSLTLATLELEKLQSDLPFEGEEEDSRQQRLPGGVGETTVELSAAGPDGKRHSVKATVKQLKQLKKAAAGALVRQGLKRRRK